MARAAPPRACFHVETAMTRSAQLAPDPGSDMLEARGTTKHRSTNTNGA